MKLFQKLPKQVLWVFAPLILIAAIFNSWFLHFGVRTAGDWGYMLDVTSETLRRFYFSTWLSDNQFGRVLIDVGQAPTYAVYGWLTHYIGTSYAINERLIHLWPAVIFAIFGSYLLVKYIFNDRATAVLGAIVYAANTYYLALLTGHLTLAGAYAFAPLVILFYLKAIGTRDVVQVALCALAFAISGAYEPRSATILGGVLALLAIYHFAFIYVPKHGFKFWPAIKTLCLYAAPFVLFGLMNIYWLLGLKFAGGTGSGVIESSLFGNEFFNISETLTLLHPFWSGGLIEPFILHHIPFYFWLIPIAAITGFAANRRSRVILFFMLLGILGILLSKQSDGPFPSLYYWLFKNVPGFNLFREASKFYILITLSYAVLIPSLFWYVKRKYKKKYLTVACFVGIAMLFLPNLIPVSTSKIGATFANRTMPQQYTELNDFLNTDSFERVLWVPQKSRWGLVSALHPTVSASKLLSDSWKDLHGSYIENNNATPTDEINSMLSQGYMPVMLSNGGIKYVVIPLRDVANSDNFFRSYNDDPELFARTLDNVPYLKKASKQIPGFAIYETTTPPKSYFSSTTNIYAVNSSDDLSSAYGLFKDTKNPVFLINDATKATQKAAFTTDVTDLFAGYKLNELKQGELKQAQTDTTKATSYYFDQSYAETSYKATDTSMTFRTKQLQQPIKDTATGDDNTQTIALDKSKTYMLQTGSAVNKVSRKNDTVNLGSPRTDSTLYSVESKNLLPKTEKTGLWQKEPEDCAPYAKPAPDLAMSSQMDGSINERIISLSANNHAACTGPNAFPVKAGTYVWHFKYKGISAQMMGYSITFDKGEPINRDISIADSNWHTFDATVKIPDGATTATVRLIVRPSNQVKDTAMVYFAEPQLLRLNEVATIQSKTGTLQPTPTTADRLTNYQAYKYDNKLTNGSFENGLWQKKVGDCNAFDTNADLKMSLNDQTASDGKKSLQLEARQHTACTDIKKVGVQGGATYLLQFDYQSPNADTAGFNITLDDKASTYIEQQIPIKDGKWHTFSKTITMPSDAHELSLAVFAFSSNEDKSAYVVNRYDNFVLQQVPDIKNRFYAVGTPTIAMAEPKNITYKAVSNTKKEVTITGATKPFVLLMSEQYSAQWQLSPTSAAVTHMKVNGFENAWYIDPQQLCKRHAAACTTNADGSVDMHLTTLFTAQKWFNIGLVISTTVALGCVAIVIALPLMRRTSEKTEDLHEQRKR